MNTLTDQQLLHEYAARGSETAFAELVARHVDLVYSAALRMVRDPHLARDVTQGVFVALAKSAYQLAQHSVLSGWLHGTARNLAAKTVRAEARRRVREQEAAAMNQLLGTDPDGIWEHIAPHLDAALGALSEADRDALLLRYFERKSAHEMAQVLGVSGEAAQKRVSRAVERLREFFAKRGVTVGASGLCVVISTNAVQAAPAGLATAIATAGPGTVTAANSATTAIALTMTMQKKALLVIIIAVLLSGGITAHLVTREPRFAAHGASELAGKWSTIDGKETLDFLSDGTCQGRDEYGRNIKGKYAFIDDRRIRLDLTIATVNREQGTVGIDRSSGVCGVEVQNNQLTLTDESGAAKRYTRIQ